MEKTASARSHGETMKGNKSARGNTVAVAPHRKITNEERMAAFKFLKATFEDALAYLGTSDEEVEEEYRRAGKLHKYDPDTEWKKRYAKIARMYPPPDFLAPNLDEFTKILEEDEQDHPIGLAGCVGIFGDHCSDDL